MARKRINCEVVHPKENVQQGALITSRNPILKKRPFARNAANARERSRMRILSKGFSRLKSCLPWVPSDTKLSKLDTLRLATSYIAHLRQVLLDESPPSNSHPVNMSWPFVAQQQHQVHKTSVACSSERLSTDYSSCEISNGGYSPPDCSTTPQIYSSSYCSNPMAFDTLLSYGGYTMQ